MDQWHLARAQSSPDSPRCSSDASRQVATGMACAGKANAARGHFGKLRRGNESSMLLKKLAPFGVQFVIIINSLFLAVIAVLVYNCSTVNLARTEMKIHF